MEVFREAVKQNPFDVKDSDAFVVPLSGFLKRDRTAVMGIGMSALVAERWPGVASEIGSIIKRLETDANKNSIDQGDDEDAKYKARKAAVRGAYLLSTPNQIDLEYEPYIFCYFIQPNGHVTLKNPGLAMSTGNQPSFKAPADLDLIRAGAIDLVRAADELNLNNIVIPRPGCEISARDNHYLKIRDIFLEILDRRFLVVASRGSHSRVPCFNMEQLQAIKKILQTKEDLAVLGTDPPEGQESPTPNPSATKFVRDSDLPF